MLMVSRVLQVIDLITCLPTLFTCSYRGRGRSTCGLDLDERCYCELRVLCPSEVRVFDHRYEEREPYGLAQSRWNLHGLGLLGARYLDHEAPSVVNLPSCLTARIGRALTCDI